MLSWKIREQIAQQGVTAIRAVLLAAATDRQEARTFLVGAARQPLSRSLPEAQASCLAVLASYILSTAEAAESRTSLAGERTTQRAYVHHIHGYAAGWLGSALSEAWAVESLQRVFHFFKWPPVSRRPNVADNAARTA